MSDETFDSDAPEPEAEPDNAVIRTLREQAKGAKAAEARADAAEKKLAFVQAGINPEDPRQRYFAEGYRGEMTASAIRAEAEAAGFLDSPTTTTTSEPQGMTAADRAAFAATSDAAAGGHVEPPAADPYAEFRGVSHRSGESSENFAMRLAQTVEANGGDVSYQGPFREFPGDSGILPSRPGTPQVRRI